MALDSADGASSSDEQAKPKPKSTPIGDFASIEDFTKVGFFDLQMKCILDQSTFNLFFFIRKD